MKRINRIKVLLNMLNETPLSVHQIVCRSGFNVRTVNADLELIEFVQCSGKISKIIKNSRVFFRKTRNLV